MKKLLFVLMVFVFGQVLAHEHNHDPYKKTFVNSKVNRVKPAIQQELRSSSAWQQFIAQHGEWKTSFDECTGFPRSAYGKPIRGILSSNPQEIAGQFLNNELSRFNIPQSEIVLRSVVPNKKHYYVHYKQVHQGLEVMWAKGHVAITKDGNIVNFSLDFRNNININLTPSLNRLQAENAAYSDIQYAVQSSKAEPSLKILPIPSGRKYNYHLVYEVFVDAVNDEGFPARYYTLVDAHNGEVLYRQNRITQICSHQPSVNTDVSITGTVYPNNPYNPSAVMPLKHLRVVIGGNVNYTDANGQLTLPNTSPVSATIPLHGRWARVYTGTTTPSVTVNLNPGANTVDYDLSANIKELTAYWSVQEVHDYFKIMATGSPAENTMDFVMTTNVDVAGSCNAFYSGTSINFFAQGGVCNATSLIPDVIYHEYGHGINYDVYTTYGGSWSNGAMGEGYADLWANAITEDPILGIGFFQNDPTGFVRRYDINPKVYPQDLVGEVHADGEIIAGAWWDTGINFNSQQDRMELLWETYAALCDASDGNEGFLFEQILVASLIADDNDGDLTNGTPRYCEITSAFARHGIFDGGFQAEVIHTEPLSASSQNPITVTASTGGLIPNSVLSGYYKPDGTGSWIPFTLNNTGGLNFSGNIPPQAPGSITHYYIDYVYSCQGFNTTIGSLPLRADDPTNPNIPFYVLNDYTLLNSNFVENASGWTLGAPGDSATTGIWVIANPNPTYLNGTSGMVQPGDDHTTAPGVNCAVTGNNPATGAGTDDIDGGKTTLISPAYDLSSYVNPAFTYWRWYTNDQGATPGTDFWQVAISNDGGNTWTDIENTNVSDHSWRRFAFRVADFVTPTANVKIRFIGEDAGQGSLVEALVDDLELWEGVPLTVNELQNVVFFNAYPIPVKDELNIRWSMTAQDNLTITVSDMAGRKVNELQVSGYTGFNHVTVSLKGVSKGMYILNLKGNKTNHSHRFSVN